MSVEDNILKATDKLIRQLARLRFAEPVTHVYNPLVYAKEPHTKYIKKYAKTKKLEKMECKRSPDKCPHHKLSAGRALSDAGK